jgi:hypothetical protein
MTDLLRPSELLRIRLIACGAAVTTVAVGLEIRITMSGDVAKFAGDALYTVLVYTLVVLFAARVKPGTAAGVALAISWAVEFLQLSGVPTELSRRSLPARLVLGSTFNPPDLFWYVMGAALCLIVHSSSRALRRGGRRSGPAADASGTASAEPGRMATS